MILNLFHVIGATLADPGIVGFIAVPSVSIFLTSVSRRMMATNRSTAIAQRTEILRDLVEGVACI
ncbi:hypothetical protein L9F63_009441, partial [Diploptera punctata]